MKKLRINTIKRPKPTKPNEKVAINDKPTIRVFKLVEILWTISDVFVGWWEAK